MARAAGIAMADAATTTKRPWFDPRLSMGNVITILMVAGAVMGGWFKFDNRLALLEREVATNKYQREAEDARLASRLAVIESERGDLSSRVIRIEERLVSQGEKLDRVLESVERGSWRTK